MDQAAERELIEQARKGDSDAFAALMQGLEPGLRHFIASRIRVRPEVEAEDVLQDTRIYLSQRLDRYNPAYPLAVFARGLATNIIKRHLFKKSDLVSADAAEEWNGELSPAELEKLPVSFRNLLGEDRFSEQNDLQPASRLFLETLEAFFRYGGYPHQQVSFGFSVLVWGKAKRASRRSPGLVKVPVTGDPGRVVQEVGPRELQPASDDMVAEIQTACCLEQEYLRRVRKPLDVRLTLTTDELFANDKTSARQFASLARRRTGETILKEYFGRDSRKSVTDWTGTVKLRVRAAIADPPERDWIPLPPGGSEK